MKYTNRLGLPHPFVKAVEQLNPPRNPESGKLGLTTMLRPPQMVALEREHWDELIGDVSDRVWSLWGTMGHLVLQAAGQDVEGEVSITIHGVNVVGHYDLILDGVMWDWKNTSAYAVKDGPKPEWVQQMNCYAYMLNVERPGAVTALRIGAILRDWSRLKIKDDYPRQPVVVMEVPLWNPQTTRSFMERKVIEHLAETPRECTDEERWAKPAWWAVMSKGRKSAHRVLPSEEAANKWMEVSEKGDYIEERPATYPRCENYCPVSAFCKQWARTCEASASAAP